MTPPRPYFIPPWMQSYTGWVPLEDERPYLQRAQSATGGIGQWLLLGGAAIAALWAYKRFK